MSRDCRRRSTLRSLNVVLDLQLNIKICDFGLTESMERTHITKKNNGGSPRFVKLLADVQFIELSFILWAKRVILQGLRESVRLFPFSENSSCSSAASYRLAGDRGLASKQNIRNTRSIRIWSWYEFQIAFNYYQLVTFTFEMNHRAGTWLRSCSTTSRKLRKRSTSGRWGPWDHPYN